MPIAYTKGNTAMTNEQINAAVESGETAPGTDWRVEIRNTQGEVVQALLLNDESAALSRAAEIIAPQYGFSAEVWGLHHTLASNPPES